MQLGRKSNSMFKDHFVWILAGVDPNFPIQLWLTKEKVSSNGSPSPTVQRTGPAYNTHLNTMKLI